MTEFDREAIISDFTLTAWCIPIHMRRRLSVESLFTILHKVPGFMGTLASNPNFHRRASVHRPVHCSFGSEDDDTVFYDYDVQHTYRLRNIGVKALVYYKLNSATSLYDFHHWVFKFRGIEVSYYPFMQNLKILLRSNNLYPVASEAFEIRIPAAWPTLIPPSLDLSV